MINPYREKVFDFAYLEAFGTKRNTREGVYFSHGTMIARTFAKGSQSRADTARSLRPEAQEVIEAYGPKVPSTVELDRIRAISKHAWRGVPQAVTAAGSVPPRQRVTLRLVARVPEQGSFHRARLPK
jgi:hypothetical protein